MLINVNANKQNNNTRYNEHLYCRIRFKSINLLQLIYKNVFKTTIIKINIYVNAMQDTQFKSIEVYSLWTLTTRINP